MDSYRKRRLRALLEAKVEDKETAALIDKFAALKREQERLEAQAREIKKQVGEIAPILEKLTNELGDKILQTESVTIKLSRRSSLTHTPRYKNVVEELGKLYVELVPIINDLKEEYTTISEKAASFKVITEGVVDSFFKQARSLLVKGAKAMYKIYKSRIDKIGKKIDLLDDAVESM